MSSPLPPEMRKPIPTPKEPKEYRDPEPPMGMRATPTLPRGPVNPNAGMMGIALAAQRERNKKAMLNPSGTSRTGVSFNEAPRGRGMQTPMNLPTPMMGRNPPEPVMPPEPVREPVREPVMPPEPVMPEREPPPRDIPMALPTRRILKVGESPVMQSYAKGGMVKTASSRGDGIASRGRTRGKIC
jgi:hypothetical protein